jgi:hypothetical protein
VRHGTIGGDSDSELGGSEFKRASPTRFVDVEGVGAKSAGEEVVESEDMGIVVEAWYALALFNK